MNVRGICFVLLAYFSATAFAAESKIGQFSLDNGLQVYVKEDHRAPVVVFQIWYHVGSLDEQPGTTGIAHVLEHIMFKGTKKYPEGQFNKIITERGGSQNAGTSTDYTYYYQLLDKQFLELSFELESDRMENLQFTENDLIKELDVVKEERRMRTDSRPSGVLYERFLATAFISSPYHYPIIGWMHEIDQITPDDVTEWYKKWYAPNNAFIVVAGDVTTEQVKTLTEKYFAKIPRQPVVKTKKFREIAPLGERRVEVNIPARVPKVIMGFNTPVIDGSNDDSKAYALEVLAGILDGGRSSRFSKELVREQQIVSDVSASYDLLGRLPGLFTVTATPAQGKTPLEVEAAVMAQIKKLQKILVSADELSSVKKQIIAQKTFSQDSIEHQAALLGHLILQGLPVSLYDGYVDKLSAVTAAQIQQVAQEYLIKQRLTVATLVPKGV